MVSQAAAAGKKNLRLQLWSHGGTRRRDDRAQRPWGIGNCRRCERRARTLFNQLSLIGNPAAELQKQQANLRRLEELKLAHRELGKPIPYSKVIQQVQNNGMERGMAAFERGNRCAIRPGEGQRVCRRCAQSRRAFTATPLASALWGSRRNDEQISRLLGSISTNPLFSDVTLDYTRAGTLEGYSVLKFEIQMSMDLERLTAQDPDSTPTHAEAAATPMAAGGDVHGQ